jgi:mono/diheme cytochrome c family protein
MHFLRATVCVLVGFMTTAPLTAQPSPIDRGRYLVEVVAFCGVCHNARDANGQMIPGKELAGGRVMALQDFRIILPNIPPGDFRAIAPNITPDPETGIGRWTDSQIATAIREGRRPDGSIIGPPMPIVVYRGISDNDLAAIVAYLKAAPSVRNLVAEHSTYPFALEPYGAPINHVADPPNDPVARGAYIAGPLAHCIDCHTPALTVTQRDWTRTGTGGLAFQGPWGIAMAPDITAANGRGRLGNWTDEQIVNALTQGVSADGRKLAPPMTSRVGAFSRLASEDVNDLIAYLRSLPQ